MAEEVSRLLAAGHAVSLWRTDSTPQARREKWSADFYDLTRSGAKRRRYKKSSVEREWEAMAASGRKRIREDRKVTKDGNVECRLCGAKWYRKAADYGLEHTCEGGLA